MKKNKKAIIIIVVIIILIFVVRAIKSRLDTANDLETGAAQTGGGSNISTTPTTKPCDNNTILKKGSNCKQQVQWSQYEINKVVSQLGISKLIEDGVFGSKTEAAFSKLLGKTTGSYSEVFNKVKTKLGTSSATRVTQDSDLFTFGGIPAPNV